MGRDTLPAFPSHSFPYCYRKSYPFIDSLKPPVCWRFEAALPLQTAAASGCLFTPSCYGIISISGKKYRIAIFVKIAILCWQREKDSNPHIRSQSPLCYLYTIPLCSDEQKLLYRFSLVCQQFFRALLPLIFTSIFPTTAAGVPTAPQRGISTHIRCPLL